MAEVAGLGGQPAPQWTVRTTTCGRLVVHGPLCFCVVLSCSLGDAPPIRALPRAGRSRCLGEATVVGVGGFDRSGCQAPGKHRFAVKFLVPTTAPSLSQGGGWGSGRVQGDAGLIL